MSFPHKSVLLEEILFYFKDTKLNEFIDATLGAGGHSEAILKHHPEIEHLTGFDQDEEALEIARKRLNQWQEKVRFIHDNFENIDQRADGILADLGVSSMQLDQGEKGFSFMKPGPLDMRMNKKEELTAKEIVNTWSEWELARIFRDYGEEKKGRMAARAIVKARESRVISRTDELNDLLYPLLKNYKSKIHPLTLIFQALRIAVNRELETLEIFLPKAVKLLNPGGRLAVITFHSLEDRIVKHFFQHEASDKLTTSGWGGVFIDKDPTLRIITRKPVTASLEEIESNPRARSAKLRVIEKL